ncbi:MAG: hypothetical protein IPJ41_08775 [Phycisphaerales bacterium]|nr:hypothetical protein [Phycisphaerales bacterium]
MQTGSDVGKQDSLGPVLQAERMYRAVLAPWAMDLLSLRHRGLDRPSRRYANGLVLRPAQSAPPAAAPQARRRAA